MELHFDDAARSAATQLIELALAEDLGDAGDLTCQALIENEARAAVQVVARQAGVIAGSPVAEMVFERLNRDVKWTVRVPDGQTLQTGSVVAEVSGPLRALLTGERTALNFLTHLSGVATLTRRFVDAIHGTRAAIYDTRKTLPGFRVLEKYAVRAGGGRNHRLGLYDGCLIKDNHLAWWTASHRDGNIAAAVRQTKERLGSDIPIEVEVDTLEQLHDALAGAPDMVLLDNMEPKTLREAVTLRDRIAPQVLLEASGGVTLETVRAIAQTGVERISVGAVTHSAPALDLAFDWKC